MGVHSPLTGVLCYHKYMKLRKPTGKLTQGFGQNPDIYKPLKGHPALDYIHGFRQPIESAVTAPIYSILNQFNPDTQKYRCIYQVYDELDSDISYEIAYGHIYDTLHKEGDIVEAGKVIASEGNYGFCFSGGKTVTAEEKPSGKGSHLHFQVRKCKRVDKIAKGKRYLRNSEGNLKRAGKYYEIVDYENGYNGLVNPAQFYPKSMFKFETNIEYGQTSDEVKKLQSALTEYGTFSGDKTGYYGDITATAVLAFQVREKLLPTPLLMLNKGKYVHALTRSRLNKIFA